MNWMQRVLDNLIAVPASWLIRTRVVPTDVQSELDIQADKPIIYLLKNHSVTDRVALQNAARQLGLPDPNGMYEWQGVKFPACMYLEGTPGIFRRQGHTDIEQSFTQLFETHAQLADLDVQIVPAVSFWGRAPGKTKASWRDILTDKASPNWLRKFFIVLFSGRHNLLYFSRAVSSRYMVDQRLDDAVAAHKLIRVARTHFHRRRQAVAGPRQMAREQIIQSVLASDAVKEAMADMSVSPEKALAEARKYADEIAGDYREGVIRLGERLLAKLWNKIYNGIEVRHAQKVRELADAGHEIIYVPCHRSHMDYLLLTYIIHQQGLMVPHIAAGINLNFFPAGPIFRRAGAFFIRRSFAGNKLYTAVFREYLQQLFTRGYPVKYYCEGGRSRTGRLLQPKTGMLAMTVQSLFSGIKRPITLVPVYIGYEHVMEVATYLKELQGTRKEKESFLQVFSAIRKLKNYGRGYLNFGEPIQLARFLEQQQPNWRDDVSQNPDKKPSWLTPVTNKLANQIMRNINRAGAINGMTLCATSLLASDKLSMTARELSQCLHSFMRLLQDAPYSADMTLPDSEPGRLLEDTLSLNKFSVTPDSFGRIVSMDSKTAVAMTYYRNNVLHLLSVPGLLATMLSASTGMTRDDIIERMLAILPLLRKELFVHHSPEEFVALIERTLDAMAAQHMLIKRDDLWIPPARDDEAFLPLWILARNMQDTLQRYAVVLTIAKQRAGLSRSELEKTSIQLAERLTAVHGINAPEFYDKAVISGLIAALRDCQLLEQQNDGSLNAASKGQWLLGEVMHWLHPQVAQSIRQTGSAA
ncbi:glycerol-3-phosphate 1-O-acyltransferase PlsB [Bowmanella sp. JS7-9]|uniref:glycerol-3-phosphate 1-O-acyltransferase PlsB n=1 Tax=Alteromonadaceae TaxID=72275 RepID=UPI00103BC8CD|nr:glycerol-3-phosphate 1-O-acyltransferase PlsB [Bowmanella sp. JS7-9]TBX20941.1 glycerol-3-phosphate acyltransferase [Bowmanella sp. JS7-9]